MGHPSRMNSGKVQYHICKIQISIRDTKFGRHEEGGDLSFLWNALLLWKAQGLQPSSIHQEP